MGIIPGPQRVEVMFQKDMLTAENTFSVCNLIRYGQHLPVVDTLR
jgi:hypothetical protein